MQPTARPRRHDNHDSANTLLHRWAAFTLVAVAAAVSARPALSAEDGEARRAPNIVLIMADDMGFSDIGCYGGEVDTPHLNRMAAEGLRFTHFYNCAKCTTTRAALVTGLYPRPQGGLLKTNMVTLGEVLRGAGYQTALFGKWHLGRGATSHPYHRGFDEYYGLLDGCCNFFDPSQPDPDFKGGRVRFFGHNDERITQFPDDFYTTDAFTDHAVDAIRKFSSAEKPFFVHVCYTAPHYPLHAKPKDIAKYKGKYLQGWEAMRRERHARQIEMGIVDPKWKLSETDANSYEWEAADKEWEDLRMAVYAAMIDCMDQNIGRMLKALEETGTADNTLILFLSDNGGCAEEPGGRNTSAMPGQKEFYTAVGPAWGWAQNTPFRRYKSWVHEGGISTPLIVRWPGVTAPGELTHQVGHLIDMMPTFAEVAGAKYPAMYNGHEILPPEGRSLTPVLRGQQRDPPAELCWEWAGNRAIRQGDWKLVWDTLSRPRRWELHNLAADRSETNDLADLQPELVERMAQAWYAWAERTGVKWKN